MNTLQRLLAAGLLAGAMAAHAGVVTGSTVVFDLNPNDAPRSAVIGTGTDLSIGVFSLDFNSGANGDVFNWTASVSAFLGQNTSFVLSGLQFDDGSTLTGFDVLSSELTDLIISTTASSLTVSFTSSADEAGGTGTVFSGRYLTSSPAAVPEPSALALVGISLAGLALMRQRKR